MFACGGGPVYIPKFYDGRNKTFWFASYSGARYRVGGRSYLIVPSPAFRSGNFSALNGLITVKDPLAGLAPFANNTIPSNRISSISQTVQDLLYPNPNQEGVGAYRMTNNYFADPGRHFDSNVYSFRGDHRISDNNFLFVRVGLTMRNGDTNAGPLKNGYGDSLRGNIPGRSIVISDTHSFSPSLVHELKLGYNRTLSAQTDYNFGADVQSLLGIQGISHPGNDPGIAGMPQFTFGGAIPVASSTNRNNSSTAQNTYQILDNISWFHGSHTIKFGFDIRHMQVNSESQPLNLRGSYSFNDQLSGLAYANFL
jgi:hypothetical protein